MVQINAVLHCYRKACFTVEEELQTALCAECTTELGEVRADVSYGTHMVVGSGLYEDCYTVRSVSFVIDLLIAFGRFIRRFLNSAVDVILRHVLAFTLLDECTKTRVGVWIRSTLTGSNRDFFS